MSSLLWIALGVIALLILLDKLPGVRLLAKPVIESLVKVLTLLLGGFGSWALYFVKSHIRAHIVFFRHLITKREIMAPEERVQDDGTLKK